jgi:hypothetical protein
MKPPNSSSREDVDMGEKTFSEIMASFIKECEAARSSGQARPIPVVARLADNGSSPWASRKPRPDARM